MVADFKGHASPLIVDNVLVKHAYPSLQAKVGWQYASQDDARKFLSVMAHAYLQKQGNPKAWKDPSFEASYEHLGLHVFLQGGERPEIEIHNPSALKRRSAIQAIDTNEASPSEQEKKPESAITTIEPMAKMWIVLRKDINMRKGKMVGQGGHGVMDAMLLNSVHDPVRKTISIDVSDPAIENWMFKQEDGIPLRKKIVLGVDDESQLLKLHREAIQAKLRCALVKDIGQTEFRGIPTHTCLVIGPHWPKDVDPLVRHLSLL